MPQIEFDGLGQPISTIALPPFGSGSELPPTVLVFNDSADFPAQVYRDLGFTHYEVWCVGAAGGGGGDILDIENTSDPNWTRYMPIQRVSFGGEGGGGGMQFAAGLLPDLPPIVPVVVGKRGADGVDGNQMPRWGISSAMQPFAGVPTMMAVTKDSRNIPGMVDGNGNAIPPYFFVETSPYLFHLNPYYIEPQDGQNGGHSSFNDATCQASGGTAGKKTPVFLNSTEEYRSLAPNGAITFAYWNGPGGNGGEGGSGGRTQAGGGGKGATVSTPEWNFTPGTPGYGQEKLRTYTPPQDGSWDGSIGKGGGGGRGGSWRPARYYSQGGLAEPPVVAQATWGGNGSFNYGDTSVYGPKGVLADYKGRGLIIPGGGGGARVQSKLKYGSKAPGYSPDGLVVVRLTRIV